MAFPAAGSWAIVASGPSHRLTAIPLLAPAKIFSRPRRERHCSVTFIEHSPTWGRLARAVKGVNLPLSVQTSGVIVFYRFIAIKEKVGRYKSARRGHLPDKRLVIGHLFFI